MLNAPECRSALGWGDHFTDQRSYALGVLGKYEFFRGNLRRALELWDAADDAMDVDEVIAEMCELIAEHSAERFNTAMSLADYVVTKTVKAKIFARLSKFA